MKSVGIVRKVDSMGRMVVPKEVRNILGWDEGRPIEIFVDGESVVLKAYWPGCIFCNNLTDLTEFKGRLVCKTCIRKIGKEGS